LKFWLWFDWDNAWPYWVSGVTVCGLTQLGLTSAELECDKIDTFMGFDNPVAE
jgi:hypothetical protein